MPRPKFQKNTPTKIVSSGSVSAPKTPPWRPKAQPAPRKVSTPQTIVP
jgi:hypothetical protein